MSKDEISVPRELLERLDFGKDTARALRALPDLRALLAQPSTCTKGGGQGEPGHSVGARFSEGIEAAAKLIERRIDEYVNEHGSYDHDTGCTEFPGNGEETVEEWLTLAESIRAISPPA